MQIESGKLHARLKDARYKILVAVRPLAPARSAFNLTLQALVDSVRASGDDSTAIEAIQHDLQLQED